MANITVIMPLFNAEKYLSEALQSVLNQTYKEFELICINDYSTDRTRSIIEEFQKRDSRIRILDNEGHLGAALSRNKGLRAARGKYVIFLDGDDIFEEELLESASDAMERFQTDIVLFEYCPHVPSEIIYQKKVIEYSESFIAAYCKKPFAVIDFAPEKFPNWTNSPCNKMFRKQFIEKNNLLFQNLPSSNDVYFVKMALFCAERIIWLDDRRVMVYAREHSEPSRISNDRNPMCSFYALEKLFGELKERNMFGKFAEYLFYILPSYLLYALRMEKEGERKKNFYYFLQNEGIEKCIAYGREFYEQIRIYDKYLIENFLSKPYESDWFYDLDTYFQVCLRKNGNVICKFIEERIQKKEIFLWGIGTNGLILLKYLCEKGIKLSGIVDCDENKYGMAVYGYNVGNPKEIVGKADYILFTSKTIYEDVKTNIKGEDVVPIDLLELLTEEKVS